jgi:L-rhamnose mutarotase
MFSDNKQKVIRYIFALLLICFLFISFEHSNEPVQIKRYGSVTGLKPEKLAYYKKLHTSVWPAVLKKIKECHIRNYSIYLQKIQNNYYLFSYLEYAGSNFAADMKKMAADPITRRWWKETDPCQQPLPQAAAKNQIWTNMEEVFHTN